MNPSFLSEAIYNTVTLGAPAVHHSRFATGGLARMKANTNERNKRLCFLQDKLQDVLVLNSDIDDALDHLTHILDSPSTNIDRSVLKLSLQRVVKAVCLSLLFDLERILLMIRFFLYLNIQLKILIA